MRSVFHFFFVKQWHTVYMRSFIVVVAVVIILATLTWFGHARFEYRTPQLPKETRTAIGAGGELNRPATKEETKIG
jgi:hypothetical protein